MTRAVVFILMLIPIAFYNAVKPDELSVSVTTPDELKKGESGEVIYSFTRGDIKGFGRLQETFPGGVELEAIETSGATFTFDNDIMKVIWLNLPKNKEFEVRLKITATESVKAEEIKVGGKLSYLVDNKRQTYTVPNKVIDVIHPEVIAAKEAAAEEANKVEVYGAQRIFESQGDDRYKVTLKISKSAFGGFGKIEEFVPLGATAEALETEKAVFSFIKDKAKFVWMAIPTKEELTVSYTLDMSGASTKETSAVKGTFSYLDNKETKTSDILTVEEDELLASAPEKEQNDEGQSGDNSSTEDESSGDEKSASIEEEEKSTADEEPLETAPAEPTEDETAQDNSDKSEAPNSSSEDKGNTDKALTANQTSDDNTPATKEEEQTQNESGNNSSAQESTEDSNESTAADNNLTAGTTQNMDPDKGVSYRVQIAAGQNVVDKPYFKKRHNFAEDFFIDNHEGWVKYTTGTFGVYKEARDKREVITQGGHKFDGPFVTAYNNGERITVQEALMITKQKWFK